MGPRRQDHRAHVDAIVRAVLAAVEPAGLVERALAGRAREEGERAVIAVGKAAARMYHGYVRARGEPAARVMVVPEGVDAPGWAVRGSHPTPTEASERAGRAVEEFVRGRRGAWGGEAPDVRRGAGEHGGTGRFVLLLSGGASSLLAAPAAPLTVEDLREVTGGLLRAGADIHELNIVRKHLERLKGGRLAELVAPWPLEVLVLSDVMGDDLSVIGSGPASPDESTFADALAVLARRGVGAVRVEAFLREGVAGRHPETPKPGGAAFARVRASVIGNNATATVAAARAAGELGFASMLSQEVLTGAAAAAGRRVGAAARGLRGPRCLVFGGETTVDVGGTRGVGGRNLELALSAAMEIEGCEGVVVMSFATDGVDGPTDAAGAVVTGETCGVARGVGLEPRAALEGHDSFGFFGALDHAGYPHLVRTGPTGTNVNDVAVVLVYP